MKNLYQILLFTTALTTMVLLLFSSCESLTTKNEIADIDVPELIDRNDRIQLGKEWDEVQNQYMAQKSDLMINPDDPDAKLKLAQIFVREARVTGEHGHYYPAALQMTDEILSQNPSDVHLKFNTLMTKAGVLLSLHEFEAAKETGLAAYELNPLNAQINGVLVDAHVELGNYKQAILAADQMISIKPDLRSYSRVSYLREIHGDIEGAIEAMTYAVEAGYPGYEETAWAMLTLGNLYKSYGDLQKAEVVYKSILESRPDYPFAVGELADIYYLRGDMALAESTLNDAVTIIPEVGFYTQLAQIYKDQNRSRELESTITEIMEMLEDDVVHGHNMNLEYADLYLHLLEDTDQALAYAQQEYSKRPRNIDVNRMMAKVLIEKGDLEQAKSYIQAAGITDSNHPDLAQLKALTNYKEELSSL